MVLHFPDIDFFRVPSYSDPANSAPLVSPSAGTTRHAVPAGSECVVLRRFRHILQVISRTSLCRSDGVPSSEPRRLTRNVSSHVIVMSCDAMRDD